MEILSRRYSWVRLAVILVDAAAAFCATAFFGSGAGWIFFLAGIVFFAGVVILHRRLDHWLDSFRIWRAVYQEQIARLVLDWDHIPLPAVPSETPRSTLEVDLDLTGPRSLHHLLDSSVSRQGSQLLASWLTEGAPNLQEVPARQKLVQELAELPRFRNRLTLLFRLVRKEPLDADKLLDWLKVQYPEKRLRQVLPWVTLLAFGNVGLFVLNAVGALPPFWILSTLLYAGVYLAGQKLTGEFLSAIARLEGELGGFRPLLLFLEGYPYDSREHLRTHCAAFIDRSSCPSRHLQRVRWVTILSSLRMNPALGVLLNLLTPWDFWTAWLAARERAHLAVLLPRWLHKFHELEALVSLGGFAAMHPEHAFPKITPLGNSFQEAGAEDRPAAGTASEPSSALRSSRAVFSARRIGHPLLPPDKKVCNDLEIRTLGELLLINGSNMAGKSTFLRTVGINLCLACAGGCVDAAELTSLPFRLYTCIRISDSLDNGFSYFYAEVKRLKGLLSALEAGADSLPVFYLIDEIFRGTNNRERLIGSRSIVKSLIGKTGVGLIATHDLDLTRLAEEHPEILNYHFQDDVREEKLAFDYRLRSGPSSTTNALKIMTIEGLPVEE